RGGHVINAVTAAHDRLLIAEQVVGEAQARGEVVGVETIEQRTVADARRTDPRSDFRMDDLDRSRRTVAVGREVAQEILLLVRNAQAFPPQAEVERQSRSDSPIILEVGRSVRRAEVEGGETRLALRARDATEEEVLHAGQRRDPRPALVDHGVVKVHRAARGEVVKAVKLIMAPLEAGAEGVLAEAVRNIIAEHKGIERAAAVVVDARADREARAADEESIAGGKLRRVGARRADVGQCNWFFGRKP